MIRAVIYARYSHHDSTSKSIVDQIALARRYAESIGAVVVREYVDEAISGGSHVNRPGAVALLADAHRKQFEIVIVFKLDRFSRDMEGMAYLYNRLNYLDVELHDSTFGRASALHVGVHGLVGTMFLLGHAEHVHRGQSGTIAQGKTAGGRGYGYRPSARPGEPEIVPDQAATIRRIFAMRLSGMKPRAIAARLNAEGVPPPRGDLWNASTINGSRARGNGILRNPLFVGRLVWDRVKMTKNPATGKRTSRVKTKPPQEFSVPRLAIVDQETFDAVQALFRQSAAKRPEQQRKNKYLFSGKLRCECGGGLSLKDRDHGRRRCQCSRMKEAGACSNVSVYYLDEIERSVLGGLKQRLLQPEFLSEIVRAYNAEAARLQDARPDELATRRTLLVELQRKIHRIWRDYEGGQLPVSIAGPELKRLAAEKATLEAEIDALAGSGDMTGAIDRMSVQECRKAVMRFETVFDEGVTEANQASADLIRSLVDSITVRPRGGTVELQVEGELAGLLAAARTSRPASGGSVVAEEGLEPPTQGL
ncbi:MAG TPA: recombinase family protein [Beijerinckiaceae bacterium]|nr:recombinase family protein [Beijerinckiaceae bacterium]